MEMRKNEGSKCKTQQRKKKKSDWKMEKHSHGMKKNCRFL